MNTITKKDKDHAQEYIYKNFGYDINDICLSKVQDEGNQKNVEKQESNHTEGVSPTNFHTRKKSEAVLMKQPISPFDENQC